VVAPVGGGDGWVAGPEFGVGGSGVGVRVAFGPGGKGAVPRGVTSGGGAPYTSQLPGSEERSSIKDATPAMRTSLVVGEETFMKDLARRKGDHGVTKKLPAADQVTWEPSP